MNNMEGMYACVYIYIYQFVGCYFNIVNINFRSLITMKYESFTASNFTPQKLYKFRNYKPTLNRTSLWVCRKEVVFYGRKGRGESQGSGLYNLADIVRFIITS